MLLRRCLLSLLCLAFVVSPSIENGAPLRADESSTPIERIDPDGIEHDVHSQVFGDLVVDVRLVGAELAAEDVLLLRADRRDDPRAESARHLDRRGADAARGGVHEHRVAVMQPHLPREWDVHGEEREQERGAFGEARPSGSGTSAARSTAASSA